MTSVEAVNVHKFGSLQYSEAQMRVLMAALDLFAEHGVNGTSLQMIADDIGVTKAAVYHQFRTKEAIVVGAVEIELGNLEGPLEAAEADAGGPEAAETLLNQVIKLAIGRRRLVGTLQHDPVIIRLLGDHQPFQQFMQRLFTVLLGGSFDAHSRVRAAMVAAAIGGAVTHPLVTDLDDETLRSELFGLTQRLLGRAD
jgi:AcrR family transcriptional regulator